MSRVEDTLNSTYYYELQQIEDETNQTEEVRTREREEDYYNTETSEYNDDELGNNVDIMT